MSSMPKSQIKGRGQKVIKYTITIRMENKLSVWEDEYIVSSNIHSAIVNILREAHIERKVLKDNEYNKNWEA